MARYWLTIAIATACGRVGFEPTTPGDALDHAPDDAPDASPTPVAWWKLDEGAGLTTADAVGTATGRLVAGASALPTWAIGHEGSAVLFGGDGDQVTMDAPASVANLPALTMSAWIEPSSVDARALQCLVDKGDVQVGWVIEIANVADGDIELYGYFTGAQVSRSSTPGIVAVGRWSHIIATWDGSTSSTGIRFYLDGVETGYATSSEGAGTRPDDSAVAISINCDANLGLAGAIDDVQIYDRVLTPAEVGQLSSL